MLGGRIGVGVNVDIVRGVGRHEVVVVWWWLLIGSATLRG